MLTRKSTAIRALVVAKKLEHACEQHGTGRILMAVLLFISSLNISSQTISTVVGTGTSGYSGDGSLATAAELKLPFAVTLDVAGNIYICDYENERIRKVTLSTGIITTIAGTGVAGYNGDGIAATSAEVNLPEGIVVDPVGNVYISDYNNQRIRKITASTGVITTIAGTGTQGYSGDNGPATSAKINSAQGLVLDAAGNLYIADAGNNRVRKITVSTGIITTIAGTGSAGYSGDGNAATSAKLSFPTGLAMDGAGNIYIADQNNSHIRKITASTGIITSIAGAGTGGFGSAGYNGDNIAATSAKLNYPQEVALDAAGNVYIADVSNSRVRKITVATGIITTVAGTGAAGYNGDGIAATSAELYDVDGIAFDTTGNMYLDDGENNRIRKVTFVPVPSVWNGSTASADWDSIANWTNLNIPTDCGSNVIIPAGTQPPIITRAVSIGSLILKSNIQINSGASLSICGNVTGGDTSTSIIAGTPAQIILNGSSQQNINGKISFRNLQVTNTNGANVTSDASVDIYGALDLLDGNMVNTSGGTVTLKTSGTNSYSYLKNFGGSTGTLVGSVTAELTVPLAGDNQHFIGSPVNQNFIFSFGASGDSGFVVPSYIRSLCEETVSAPGSPYGTVFSWDETKAMLAPGGPCPLYGWYCLTNDNDSIQIGKGYSVYLNSGVFSISGEPNQNSSYTVRGLANSGYSLGTVEHTASNSYTSGWQLLANPYLAPLNIVNNMLASPNSGLFDDIAVWVTSGPFEGTYQPLVANGFNGGMLAPFQGVMVHRGNGGSASATQTAASFVFNKNNLATPTSLPQFFRQASSSSLSITISGNGFQDITSVEFNTGASTGFDIGYDSRKIVSKAGQPTISTLQNGENLSYNSNPSIEAMPDIPLTVEVGTNGTYLLSFDGITSFDPTTYIFLEDMQTGTWFNIRSGSYTFTATTSDSPQRFVLHFTPPVQIQTTNANCVEPGEVTIDQPGEVQWAYTMEDNAQTVLSAGILNAANPVNISISGGIYSLILQDSSGYTVEKNIEIAGGQPVEAEFETSVSSAEEQESILFNSISNGATSYRWDFGDNSFANGQAVYHSYSSQGIYNVMLSVSNSAGCNSAILHTLSVTPRSVTGINETADNKIEIWSNANKVYVALGQTDRDATVELYNSIGQLISNEEVTSALYTRELTQQATGYFIVKVKMANCLFMKKVFVSWQ